MDGCKGARARICSIHPHTAVDAHRYLTPPRVVLKLLSAPFFLNKFFDGEGNAVYLSEHERIYGRGAKSTARSLAAARSRKGGLQVCTWWWPGWRGSTSGARTNSASAPLARYC